MSPPITPARVTLAPPVKGTVVALATTDPVGAMTGPCEEALLGTE